MLTVVMRVGRPGSQSYLIFSTPLGDLGKTKTPYLDTASLILERTVESSLIKCGLLPVFSSCSITPITISSLMPSVSTLLSVDARGEGGGVCS